ncbi:MAG TPA: HAD-IA family hydrolase [Noviherbaspirillum sp.]|nr:HAD-IA family hydrolase [Noviherbaspirillum sp.]
MQALIFDVDGTLADTERDLHRVAFNRAFRSAGLDWCWDVSTYGLLLKVAGGKERIRHYIDTIHPELVARGGVDRLVRELHVRKTDIYLSLLRDGEIRLRPGVERLLREARRCGLRLAIATTTTPENVTSLLASALGDGAVQWFDVIGAGDIVATKKPSPDIYRYVLDRLDLPAASCFAFEDSANGLRAAAGAGLRTIVTPTAYTLDEDFTGACSVVSDLGEPHAHCEHLGGHAPGRGLIDIAQLEAWQAA